MTRRIPTWGKRLLSCLAGGLVLALMVGQQEGTEDDFGLAFHDAILAPRVVAFLILGVIVFALITFWPLVKPHIRKPGVAPLASGLLAIVVSQFVMNWYDPLGNDAKFSGLGNAVSDTSGLSPFTGPFFGWLAWTLALLGLALGAVAVVTRLRPIGWVVTVIGVVGTALAFYSHYDVTSLPSQRSQVDHSLGVYADCIGFLLIAFAGLVMVYADSNVAHPREFVQRLLDYRPGLALAVLALVWGLFAYASAGWFGQGITNWDLSQLSDRFDGTGVGALATQYFSWLGWTLFVVCAVGTLAATYLRHELLAWAATALSAVGVVVTFVVLEAMAGTAAREAPQYGPKWQNLGTGGFVACLVFTLLVAGASHAGTASRATRKAATAGPSEGRVDKDTGIKLPMTVVVEKLRRSASVRALVLAGIGVALFYPPTLPVTWQNVVVGQIGVYVLLALGLNVVVGWAGLLDLGYIAFYEIGAYTTAYLVGALPVKPPSWLHMPAFAAIPFAVAACLIAGFLLGAPTLRLRGDYLAIVTLGFGEIIQVIALNNPGGFTGGPVGPTIPHPSLDVGLFSVTFGQDNLPYWYLLLIMLVIVVTLFYRLENSRLGRAWTAIREDEIAAQATGVNTTRVKLLAFAIGASTSGLAGWFFSTQVGYFDPSLFTLQASILIVAYVVFGGMGSLVGSMAGAAVLTWLPQFLKSQVPQADRQMWVGALVLAMMIFRPAGLLPAKRRRTELGGLDAELDTGETAVDVEAAKGTAAFVAPEGRS